ncbi:MAG: hypothetical protein ACXVFN_10845 [Solirubrobacteraceae bacterium]
MRPSHRPSKALILPLRQRLVLEAFFAGRVSAGGLAAALAAAAERDTAELELALHAPRQRGLRRRTARGRAWSAARARGS